MNIARSPSSSTIHSTIFSTAAALSVALLLGVGLASQSTVASHARDDAADSSEHAAASTVLPHAPVDGYDSDHGISEEDLEALVGPVALYPDALLAIVLPASSYPVQIVQAARYLERHEEDGSLEPNKDWDDAVVALLNYPEVLAMMSENLDWTWQLGEAVVAQETAVIAAIEGFRDKAYAAGNLKTDERQVIAREEGVVTIRPVDEKVVYVPYYEPERVVVYTERPVYHYHSSAYPLYYYPYAADYHFQHGYFWGVSTVFRIGWWSDHLSVHHHSYASHPYYGWAYNSHRYRHHSWYRYSNRYGRHGKTHRDYRDHVAHKSHGKHKNGHGNRGDQWKPGRRAGDRPLQRVAYQATDKQGVIRDHGNPRRRDDGVSPAGSRSTRKNSVAASGFRKRNVGSGPARTQKSPKNDFKSPALRQRDHSRRQPVLDRPDLAAMRTKSNSSTQRIRQPARSARGFSRPTSVSKLSTRPGRSAHQVARVSSSAQSSSALKASPGRPTRPSPVMRTAFTSSTKKATVSQREASPARASNSRVRKSSSATSQRQRGSRGSAAKHKSRRR